MGVLIASHHFPNCRIRNETWAVDAEFKAKVKRGDPLPRALLALGDEVKAKAKCEACGQSYTGVVYMDIDEATGTGRLINVKGPV